ncbi:MAG: DUF1156 domain-containing protein [Ignavibacteriales bacterium]
MTDRQRLIEVAFPLKQASLDSVHEKNVRHGHISTLHIWPARRPLAACRAALIATLLPDPGTPEARKETLEKLGGSVRQSTKKKMMPDGRVEEIETEETVGGVLHWQRESGPDMDWFRQKIRETYGGRPPKVLDPFAGGGAIPFEAMRLGCEATANDINPVAWFILKCTLEYPQRLAGQKRPLPSFVMQWPHFLKELSVEGGARNGNGRRRSQSLQGLLLEPPEADLSWHVRAWGRWVLERAKKDLERLYPVVDGKPTVAYLWARTVKCKNCRVKIPLLKTRWLCRDDKRRILLNLASAESGGRDGVRYSIERDVPVSGENAAQRRENDRRVGLGTVTRSGAVCPWCGAIMTREDIREEGVRDRLGSEMTAVVTNGPNGKEYRLPCSEDLEPLQGLEEEIDRVFSGLPFGVPSEEITSDAKGNTWCASYGLDRFDKLFTGRQLFALGTFAKVSRDAQSVLLDCGYSPVWVEAIMSYLACAIDRLADRGSTVCSWTVGWDKIRNTFVRFALPMTWDYAEANPIEDSTGGFPGAIEWIARFIGHGMNSSKESPSPQVLAKSAVQIKDEQIYDMILTDPPYYDAIGYSVLMDFFYVWLRRTLTGSAHSAFEGESSPKWDHAASDGELVDDAARFGGDRAKSKAVYEDGMFRSFEACYRALKPDGRFVVVFAHKHPDAWETLVSAIIRAGFAVTASWPIQTEMGNRTRALSSAALSSSVWLVCKKRPDTAGPGWDNRVLEDMKDRLHGRFDEATKTWVLPERLREFWDAGIRGPDFVWAATGPALEAFSRHPVVKKANEPGKTMSVSEFLKHVRRLVVDFVVGRVLSGNGNPEDVSGLDDLTTYYLLHRHDFGLGDAPAGACIMYAVSCGLSDTALADQFDILSRTGGKNQSGDENEGSGDEDLESGEEGTGSTFKLKRWYQRKRKSMGYEAPGDRPVPVIDQVHRLMYLWKAGNVVEVDDYLDSRGLRRNSLFLQVLQAIIELAAAGSDERSLLESISNHVGNSRETPRRAHSVQERLA